MTKPESLFYKFTSESFFAITHFEVIHSWRKKPAVNPEVSGRSTVKSRVNFFAKKIIDRNVNGWSYFHSHSYRDSNFKFLIHRIRIYLQLLTAAAYCSLYWSYHIKYRCFHFAIIQIGCYYIIVPALSCYIKIICCTWNYVSWIIPLIRNCSCICKKSITALRNSLWWWIWIYGDVIIQCKCIASDWVACNDSINWKKLHY